MKIVRNYVREILKEIGRNQYTVDTDPYSWEDYPEVDIELFPAELGAFTHAKVTCKFDPKLNTNLMKFPNEEEAKSWVRRKVDEIHQIYMNKND
jgi:hypothetical protein